MAHSLLAKAKCASCPFAKNGLPNKPVLGEGPSNPVGILVGEGPGREEADAGRPFVGATGRQLDTSLAEAGLRRSQLFIVNATCCIPPPAKNADMLRKAIACCRPVLLEQLKRFPSETPTLALGSGAYLALTGKANGMLQTRGFVRANWTLPREVRDDQGTADGSAEALPGEDEVGADAFGGEVGDSASEAPAAGGEE